MIKIDISKQLHGSNGLMDLDINADIKQGEFIALSGLSGSGKTTLLRILAGLEEASGKISVDKEVWLDGKNSLSIQKRQIGFVFQDYALFNNMSVEQNLLYVNKDKKLANKLLELTELKQLAKRMPNTLSGGQKQRVSLCRALMNSPKLLLMDEPLSALDPNMRMKLQNEILNLHKEFKTTTIMVSHEPSEIYRLANRVLVMKQGKIIQDGNPTEVLLKTSGSQKFSFEGEILDIIKTDVIYIAIISIGQQLVEIVLCEDEAKEYKVGEKVRVGTKAFAPTLSKI
ncbi:ABC transporter ATP-binding protein [Poseidonibacter ostreae]|jgi:molybdate transport system ATP-binding protein|uniref:ATP-binding cassette domain-containing protein n=1 Tax=Poseidonibacter ostreae TaxID=2654171 RepID=A0A6L4WTC8_9BACT|nr:ATP-binding cassette domain-containing protein [Poseidonibacter ostreae]KAB7887070.1 ATP-binding cassette domain-containing protein [Poseidonibacter ostreae]KAB7889206.1 ATP-binding cassette domain-containing protein [Poseidonibacter ostreae]KAB7891593.1 ATP-binding cassette domain-containing protein [Poseidonibacter ostreae]MAC84808.1 molybdenum ABC transporter ATP-binding protein [Arcobacter sp.]|tara:strand:+ start:2854 stop:3708 length:855 start_codon:yes stop_codon:yes gene_type:complete